MNFETFLEYFDNALREEFDSSVLDQLADVFAQELGSDWENYYNEGSSKTMLTLNVKGKGFGDYDKFNKGGRAEGNDDFDYHDYLSHSREDFYHDWYAFFKDKFKVDLFVTGRSNGHWGFSVSQIVNRHLADIDPEKVRDVFEGHDEYDDEYEMANAVAEDMANSEDKIASFYVLDKGFAKACSDFEREVGETSARWASQEFNDELFANNDEPVDEAWKDDLYSTSDVEELVLYITNDSDLYHRRTEPIIKNLQRKYRKGIYNADLSLKLWRVLADAGVRQYDKEFGTGRGDVKWLDTATRNAIAKALRDHYQERIEEPEEEEDEPVSVVEDGAAAEWVTRSELYRKVKEDSSDNIKSRTESLKLTADYLLGQIRGLYDKLGKGDADGAKLFFKNAGITLKDLVRQFEDLKSNF